MIKNILAWIKLYRYLLIAAVVLLIGAWGYGEIKYKNGEAVGSAKAASACQTETEKQNEKANDKVKKIKRKVRLTSASDDRAWLDARGLYRAD